MLSINYAVENEDQLIQAALCCLEKKLRYEPISLDASSQVSDYLRLQLGTELNEVFAVVFLDTQLRLLAFEKLFQGTINSAEVYPRVVIQRALAHNAANVILVHNHPSGMVEPSKADKTLTERLQSILAEINVRVLDHFIVSCRNTFSFAAVDLL